MTRDGMTAQGDMGTSEAESSWFGNKLHNRCSSSIYYSSFATLKFHPSCLTNSEFRSFRADSMNSFKSFTMMLH